MRNFAGTEDLLRRNQLGVRMPRWQKVSNNERVSNPFAAIVLIRMLAYFADGSRQEFPIGTGWFYKPNVVVTAAHCTIYPRSGVFGNAPKPHTIYLQVEPLFALPLNQSFVVSRIIYSSYDPVSSRADIALLHLPVGTASSGLTLPSMVFSEQAMGGGEALLAGYAIEWGGDLVRHQGPIIQTDANFLYYDIDAVGGHSGSPVVVSNGASNVVVGIHVAGTSLNRTSNQLGCNVGLRLDAALVNWIITNS